MGRRTVSLPDSTEVIVREHALEGESFSATVARLIEAGARSLGGPRRPSYVASGNGPHDLGVEAERYLRELVDAK